MKCCILLTSFCVLQMCYAATDNLRIYDQEFINPKAGYIKIDYTSVSSVASIDDQTGKTVYAYGTMDCTGPPLDIIALNRGQIDFDDAWEGCFEVAV